MTRYVQDYTMSASNFDIVFALTPLCCLSTQMREDYYAGLEDRYFLTYDQAKAQKLVIDYDNVPVAPTPKKIGVSAIDNVSLEDVVPYIDWVSQQVAHLLPR